MRIPFGHATRIGLLLEVSDSTSVSPKRLRPALQILDASPLLADDIRHMVLWASDYYHHPIGDAMTAALPTLLRRGKMGTVQGDPAWRLTDTGARIDPLSLQQAPRQASVLERLHKSPHELPRKELDVPMGVLHTMHGKGWIEPLQQTAPPKDAANLVLKSNIRLSRDQQAAVSAIRDSLGEFHAFLLEGVTGSGKTEVYLQVIESVINQNQQALVLVPEIGLTPQLVDRFRRRFPVRIALLHSGLSDRERLHAWQLARSGSAPIILGTRSAIFTPLQRPGILIIDEEHDTSLKQQDGFRYSARDLAVWRSRFCRIPIVLGSATPSLETLENVNLGKYRHLILHTRVGAAGLPQIGLIDVRGKRMQDGLSPPLLAAIQRHLDADGQVLLFLNRRGYAPALICHACGWIAHCERCDARMTFHASNHQLCCHHCGSQRNMHNTCPKCGSAALITLGQGTERVEDALASHFPDHERVRIDRDTTRRKGELESLLDKARSGHGRILLGTQMLAKGHHFPDVTLVGIIDADQGLFGSDFRSSERMAQLIIQVAGRAGRADRPGEVIIQTHHPEHPQLCLLIREGYAAFAKAALEERRATCLPPYASLALLRAEALRRDLPMKFLECAQSLAASQGTQGVEYWGPVPSPMERRAGRYRAQLLLQAPRRSDLQRLLRLWVPELERLEHSRQVRWSLDVDPQDTL